MQDRHEPEISGVVAALGSRCRGDVAVGAHVTFAATVGQRLTVQGTPWLVIRESDILTVVESA